MRKPSLRAATLAASALSALVLALPVRGLADQYQYGHQSGWSNPYGQQDYDADAYNRPYYGGPQYNEGWRDWRDTQGIRQDMARGRAAIRRDQRILQEKREAMNEARWRNDWDAYRQYQQEVEQYKQTLRQHQEQVEYGKRVLGEQQARRHHYNDWDED